MPWSSPAHGPSTVASGAWYALRSGSEPSSHQGSLFGFLSFLRLSVVQKDVVLHLRFSTVPYLGEKEWWIRVIHGQPILDLDEFGCLKNQLNRWLAKDERSELPSRGFPRIDLNRMKSLVPIHVRSSYSSCSQHWFKCIFWGLTPTAWVWGCKKESIASTCFNCRNRFKEILRIHPSYSPQIYFSRLQTSIDVNHSPICRSFSPKTWGFPHLFLSARFPAGIFEDPAATMPGPWHPTTRFPRSSGRASLRRRIPAERQSLMTQRSKVPRQRPAITKPWDMTRLLKTPQPPLGGKLRKISEVKWRPPQNWPGITRPKGT